MTATTATAILPLTLTEQLDAMLTGWLERHAERPDPGLSDVDAAGVVTVADRHVEGVEAFCAGWDMTARRLDGGGRWAVLRVEGRARLVRGFVEITGMYRA